MGSEEPDQLIDFGDRFSQGFLVYLRANCSINSFGLMADRDCGVLYRFRRHFIISLAHQPFSSGDCSSGPLIGFLALGARLGADRHN